MEMLEKLQQFLLGFSGWEEAPSADYGEDGPGQTGLFPLSQEVVARRKDLAGNAQVTVLARFTLRRRLRPGQDGGQWLLDFGHWLQQQKIAGLTPRFGDVPAEERLRMQKGSFEQIPRLGAGLCSVILAAEFVKVYQAGGGGE